MRDNKFLPGEGRNSGSGAGQIKMRCGSAVQGMVDSTCPTRRTPAHSQSKDHEPMECRDLAKESSGKSRLLARLGMGKGLKDDGQNLNSPSSHRGQEQCWQATCLTDTWRGQLQGP
jgi:hypothetical protein